MKELERLVVDVWLGCVKLGPDGLLDGSLGRHGGRVIEHRVRAPNCIGIGDGIPSMNPTAIRLLHGLALMAWQTLEWIVIGSDLIGRRFVASGIGWLGKVGLG